MIRYMKILVVWEWVCFFDLLVCVGSSVGLDWVCEERGVDLYLDGWVVFCCRVIYWVL